MRVQRCKPLAAVSLLQKVVFKFAAVECFVSSRALLGYLCKQCYSLGLS